VPFVKKARDIKENEKGQNNKGRRVKRGRKKEKKIGKTH
jgi:hypothetical protein